MSYRIVIENKEIVFRDEKSFRDATIEYAEWRGQLPYSLGLREFSFSFLNYIVGEYYNKDIIHIESVSDYPPLRTLYSFSSSSDSVEAPSDVNFSPTSFITTTNGTITAGSTVVYGNDQVMGYTGSQYWSGDIALYTPYVPLYVSGDPWVPIQEENSCVEVPVEEEIPIEEVNRFEILDFEE